MVAGHAPDVDDAAAPVVPHHRGDALAHAQRTLEVDGEDLAPQVEGHVADPGAGGADPGVVDEDVDAPEPLDDGVDEAGDGIPVADVTGPAERLDPGRGRDLRRHLVTQLLLAAADDDRGAGLGQTLRHRPADALGRTGHDGDPAGQVEASRSLLQGDRVLGVEGQLEVAQLQALIGRGPRCRVSTPPGIGAGLPPTTWVTRR